MCDFLIPKLILHSFYAYPSPSLKAYLRNRPNKQPRDKFYSEVDHVLQVLLDMIGNIVRFPSHQSSVFLKILKTKNSSILERQNQHYKLLPPLPIPPRGSKVPYFLHSCRQRAAPTLCIHNQWSNYWYGRQKTNVIWRRNYTYHQKYPNYQSLVYHFHSLPVISHQNLIEI